MRLFVLFLALFLVTSPVMALEPLARQDTVPCAIEPQDREEGAGPVYADLHGTGQIRFFEAQFRAPTPNYTFSFSDLRVENGKAMTVLSLHAPSDMQAMMTGLVRVQKEFQIPKGVTAIEMTVDADFDGKINRVMCPVK